MSGTGGAKDDRFRVVLHALPSDPASVTAVEETLRRHEVDEASISSALTTRPSVIVPGTDAESGRELVRDLARCGARAGMTPLRSTAEIARERRGVAERKASHRAWGGLALAVAAAAGLYAILPKPVHLELALEPGRTYRFEQRFEMQDRSYYEDDGTSAQADGSWRWTLARTVRSADERTVVVDRFEDVQPDFDVTGRAAPRYRRELEELRRELERTEIERTFDERAREVASRGAEPLLERSAYPGAVLEGLLARFAFPEHARKLEDRWTSALGSRDGIEFELIEREERDGRKTVRAHLTVETLPGTEGEARLFTKGWRAGSARGTVWFDLDTGLPAEIDASVEPRAGDWYGSSGIRFTHRLLPPTP